MCFHNALTAKPKKVAKHYGVAAPHDLYEPMVHASGFSHPQWPVIAMGNEDKLSLKSWGLIPSWVKNSEQAQTASNQNLNARSETVFEKPSFRDAIKNQRCIVPSTGFYEWRSFNKQKYPYFILPKNADLFSMAGISSSWVNPETGEVIETFSVLTTTANTTLSFIHNVKLRMPLILSEEAISVWLNLDTQEEVINAMFKPSPDADMDYYLIDREKVKYEEAGETPPKPFVYPELNTLF